MEVASFQKMNVEQVNRTSQECQECKRPKNDSENSSSRRLPLNKRCPVFLYPRLLARIQERLNNRSQSSLIAFLQRNEPERLPGCGNRTQHFCRAKHRPRGGQEHQLDTGPPIQHVRQAEQPTRKRNGFQLASVTPSVRQAKDSRGDVREPYARAAPIRL